MMASLNGHTGAVKLLLEAGANVNIRAKVIQIQVIEETSEIEVKLFMRKMCLKSCAHDERISFSTASSVCLHFFQPVLTVFLEWQHCTDLSDNFFVEADSSTWHEFGR